MAGDFKIEVPIDAKGSSASEDKGGGLDAVNKNLKKLDKTMFMNLDIIEMLSTVLGDLFKIIQPLFKILSVLFMMIFLPLLPLLKLLIEGFAWLIKMLSGGKGNLWEFIGKLVLGLLLGALAIVIIALVGWGVIAVAILIGAILLLWDAIVIGAKWVWEGLQWLGKVLLEWILWVWDNLIKPAFMYLGEWILWVWDGLLKPAWEFLKDVGSWIWEQIIKPAFDFLKDVGTWIWNILKAPFDWLASKIKSINIFSRSNKSDKVGDAIIRPNGDVIKTDPADYLIATKNPQALGGGSTININNPVVRNDSDIKKIANEVSKVLGRNLWRK